MSDVVNQGYIVAAIGVLILSVPLLMFMVGFAVSGPRYHGQPSDHFNGSKFLNPEKIKAKGGWDVFKWMLSRKPGPWPAPIPGDYGKHPLGHFKDGIRITFINHSTFLIQVNGVNILTDPVWSKRASPFSWIGPTRMRPPGIRFEDLPHIDFVLISHNHYDHLDLATMRMVFGAHHPAIFTPLGIKAFLEKQYIKGVREGDWWDEFAVERDIKIQLVPAQHFSGRGFLDRDASLWCGYVIKTGAGNIYFAGDTGYNEKTFKEIGSRCGPMRVSMLPVGAYKPAWFMSPIHAGPAEAVKIHLEVRSRTSIGMHYGTFALADDGYADAFEDLKAARVEQGLAPDDFVMLPEGEVMVFEDKP